MTKIKSDVIRAPLTHIPKDVATRVLAEPRNKLSNKSRKRFMLARSTRIEVESVEPKDIQEKYCAKLRKLNLQSLDNQHVQAGRQLNNLDRILFVIDCHHKEYHAVMQRRTLQLYRQGWIEQEIERRTKVKILAPPKSAFPMTVAAFVENMVSSSEIIAYEKGDFDPKGYQNPDGN